MKVCPKCFTEAPDSTRFCPNCGEGIPATDSDEQGMTGRIIANNFLMQEMVGEGAMGSIYKAEQTTLGKTVCIKVLHRHLSGDKTLSKRFHREARAASRIKHPNAINIIDFGTAEDGTHYIAMDFIDGQDLAGVLKKDFPLEPARILHFIDQICSALDDAHAQGIIHRDLKPENVMVEDRRHHKDFVTVLDFGIAKIKDPDSPETFHTMAGIVCGTPEYMSPEQARGEPLDARSDIYSLGVIVYQLSTGKLPFTADTPIGVVTKHLTQEPRRPREVLPSVHPVMEQFILRLMCKDKEKRPDSWMAVKDLIGEVGGAIKNDPDALAQTAPMSRPTPDELDDAVEPGKGPSTSPYSEVGELTDAEEIMFKPGMGTGAKVFLWLMVLAVLGTGGWFAYDRFVLNPSVEPETEEAAKKTKEEAQQAQQEAESKQDPVAQNDEVTAAEKAEQERLRKEKEAADAAHREKENQKKFTRIAELSGELLAYQLAYAENDRMLAMRLEDWKKRDNQEKVKVFEEVAQECTAGKERVKKLLDKVKTGQLGEVEPKMALEGERVAALKNRASMLLSEEMPQLSGQEDQSEEKLAELTQQITGSRQELAGLAGKLDLKKVEWLKTPDKAKQKEIDDLFKAIESLDKDYESIVSRLSQENVGQMAVEYGRSLGKRDVLVPQLEAALTEKVGPTSAELKKKAEEDKKKAEERKKKDEEKRRKAEELAKKKAAEEAKKKAEEDKKNNTEGKAAKKAKSKELAALGDQAMSQGSYAKAIMYYKQALKQYASASLYKKLGKTYNSKGDYANGAKYLRKYLKAMKGKLSPTKVKLIERQIRE